MNAEWKGFAALTTLAAGTVGIGLVACSSSSSSGGQPPPAVDAGVQFCAPTCTAASDCPNPMAEVCSSNGVCAPAPGTFPNAECESSALDGCIAGSTCAINEAVCGSKSTCLPMGNNMGQAVQNFRLRRLTVNSPASLAKGFVQKAVLDKGIDLHADGTMLNGAATPQCGEHGDGAFNWLITLDTGAKTVKTGGAPPSVDPFGVGYCYANGTLGGIAVAPITNVSYTMNPDGTLGAGPVANLNVPIFVHGDVNNVVVLPLHNANFSEVKISTDGNCIGSFNTGALDNSCNDVSRDDCSKWHTDGALGGYISLEESDKVAVQDLNATLCVLLTSSTGVVPATGGVMCGATPCPACKRDASGKIAFQGDYCSTTKAAGGCADSFWLSATFAASAVKINDGTGVAQCAGGGPPPVDGGTD
jgi:hypothetical protein